METTLLPQIAFGYGRVSTAKQGLSREAQTETVQRAAEYHTGGTPHEMFFDEDTSGGIPFGDRPSAGSLPRRNSARVIYEKSNSAKPAGVAPSPLP